MKKFSFAFVLLAVVLFIGHAARATPQLFVYVGAAPKWINSIYQFRAFLGRQEDGIVEFNNYGLTRANAALNADGGLGAWQDVGVKNISYAVGLAFADTTIEQVAAGVADAQYAYIGKSLVSHGFPNAYVRLGWEMNGGWYAWGQKGATYVAAFNHVAPIIKANCPGCTIVWNPAMTIDPTPEMPGVANVGAVGPDVYSTGYASAGVQTEPALWNDNYNYGAGGIKGLTQMGAPYNKLPIAIPEFGVGSSDSGEGACHSTGVNDCDDGVYMTDALAYFDSIGAAYVGYWDYDAGDANTKISDGSRPHEALAFLNEFGSAAMKAIFNAHAATFTDQPPPTFTVVNCHAIAFQNAPGHFMAVVWADDAWPSASVSWSAGSNANVYNPSSATPTAVVQALGAAKTWTGVLKPGQPIVIGISE